MDFSWLGIPLLLIVAMLGSWLRFRRSRREGNRRDHAIREAMTPISVVMQGESVRRGLPVAKLEIEPRLEYNAKKSDVVRNPK